MRSATADRPERLSMVPRERKALTGDEASRILGAAEDAKNMRGGNVVLIFEEGKLQVANVYRKVA